MKKTSIYRALHIFERLDLKNINQIYKLQARDDSFPKKHGDGKYSELELVEYVDNKCKEWDFENLVGVGELCKILEVNDAYLYRILQLNSDVVSRVKISGRRYIKRSELKSLINGLGNKKRIKIKSKMKLSTFDLMLRAKVVRSV